MKCFCEKDKIKTMCSDEYNGHRLQKNEKGESQILTTSIDTCHFEMINSILENIDILHCMAISDWYKDNINEVAQLRKLYEVKQTMDKMVNENGYTVPVESINNDFHGSILGMVDYVNLLHTKNFDKNRKYIDTKSPIFEKDTKNIYWMVSSVLDTYDLQTISSIAEWYSNNPKEIKGLISIYEQSNLIKQKLSNKEIINPIPNNKEYGFYQLGMINYLNQKYSSYFEKNKI